MGGAPDPTGRRMTARPKSSPLSRGAKLAGLTLHPARRRRSMPRLVRFMLLLVPARLLVAQAPMTPRDSARHVLARLGYGPTPGLVDSVARDGVLRWVDRQLGYRDVADPALDATEDAYDVTHVTPADLVQFQARNLAQARAAQAVDDSGARAREAAAFRDQQRTDRRSLQNLIGQLQSLTVVRAVESSHQLDEVLADFWTNHFNVYINKGLDRALFADYLDRTIRPHALGTFGDLLIATAHSPAMLFYLDNAESVAPGSDQRLRAFATLRPEARRRAANPLPDSVRPGVPQPPRGLNENYARELMELHTLGVDGGYTQQDVIAVARVLTGWTIDRRDGTFIFRPLLHDASDKTALGLDFPAGHGEDEGTRLLRLLASAPATMHHVSRELCAHFVNDNPPDGCVDDAVQAWKESGGDIRAVVRAIVHSPDFWAPVNVGSKFKTPLEFVVSAVRAVGGTPDATPRLAQRIGQLGEPLFQKQTPDGYGESEADWANSGALLARWNFAIQLASGRMPGVTIDLDRIVPLTPEHAVLVASVDTAVLGGAMTAHTRDVMLKELEDVSDPTAARAFAVGMALGSPEFQKR